MSFVRALLAWLFALGVRLRNALHDRGLLRVRRARVPVVSIGALEVGGSGKTPLTRLVCELAVALGFRPAVLIRGYKSRLEREGGLVRASDPVERAGDEALWLARTLEPLGVCVYAGRQRWRLAAVAAAEGANLLVLDDGFQHRRLYRDVDVVLVDGDRDPASLALLPRGPLRERVTALARANVLVVRGEGAAPRAWQHGFVRAREEAVDVVELPSGTTRPLDSLRGCDVTLLAGIARPERFLMLAQNLGVHVVEERLFRDHHVFSPDDVRAPRAPLLTTEKDATRLPPGTGALVLRHRLRIGEGEALLRESLVELSTRQDRA